MNGEKKETVAKFITYTDFTGKTVELMVINMKEKNSIAFNYTREGQQTCEVMPAGVAEQAAKMVMQFRENK